MDDSDVLAVLEGQKLWLSAEFLVDLKQVFARDSAEKLLTHKPN